MHLFNPHHSHKLLLNGQCSGERHGVRSMLKSLFSEAAADGSTGGVIFSPVHPKPLASSVPMGYVEDAFEAGTTHGKRRVLAHLGWVGEKSGFFSILPENYFRVRTDWSAKLTRGLG
jgi:hypothetical protein